MQTTVFRSGQETDTLVVSYYPLAGNDTNTGPRYQAEATMTGFDIVGITRDGTNMTVKDSGLRASLSQENFDEYCAEQAEALQPKTADYDMILFRGQSTGGFPTLGVIKSGIIRATHLLLEDGINLRRGFRGRDRGPLSARLDWLSSMVQERWAMPRPPVAGWECPPAGPEVDKLTKFRTELYYWSDLWRSSYGRDTTLEIARSQPELPILVKFLGHTATTTPGTSETFTQDLYACAQLRRGIGRPAADIQADYDPDAWHGYLVYPQYGAANLRQAAAMQSFVT